MIELVNDYRYDTLCPIITATVPYAQLLPPLYLMPHYYRRCASRPIITTTIPYAPLLPPLFLTTYSGVPYALFWCSLRHIIIAAVPYAPLLPPLYLLPHYYRLCTGISMKFPRFTPFLHVIAHIILLVP